MNRPLVSVCIPCFNSEHFVGAALESVLAQTWSPIEIIVVDDGSTDGSAEVLAEFAHRGVKVISQTNAGQCAAANRALAQTTGEYIKFFDADDIMGAEMISLQVKALQGRVNAVAMGEWARFQNDPSEAQFGALPMYRNADPVDWLASEWSAGQPMMQCAMWLIPAAILRQAGGWDERLSLINDFEFFARVLTASKEIVYTPGARLHYRSGVFGSLSGQRSRRAAESAALSLRQGADHLLAAENSPRTRRACANMLKTFDYDFYPAFPDLRHVINERVAELGGADLAPVGPPGFHALRRWVGWRAARRVQHLAERMRLNSVGRIAKLSGNSA